MKKKFTLLVLIFLISLRGAYAQDFITKWSFPAASSSISFYALTAGAVNYTWTASPSGNSGSGSFTSTNAVPVTLSGLTIAANDIVTLTMLPQNLQRFYIDQGNNATNLVDVSQWGTVHWTSMTRAFLGCSNLNISATDVPDLSGVTDMSIMFGGCTTLSGPLNINSWNTSSVTDMGYMFYQATAFNQGLGTWVLNPSVGLSDMLVQCGMDYCTYSSTLKGWCLNNPTVTNRDMGPDASGMLYTTAVGNAERNTLVNTRGWTLFDAPVSFNPLLVAAGSTIAATPSCDEGVYLQPANTFNKVLGLNANGNSFDYGTAAVTVTNAFAAALPSGATTDASGFYEINSGSNTFRVSRRLHTIQAPGSYTTNGGVIVRVYYDPAEITALTDNGTLPAGSNLLVQQGWFKSAQHSAQDVVNDMTAATLNNAIQVTPTGSGTENGVDYMEFTLPSFSTIGYYATTSAIILPVKLVYFTGASNGCAVSLQWKTALESNLSYFEIERSSDAVHYSVVYTQMPTTQSTGAVYNYTDKSVTDGSRYYYRLKTVDNDGRYAYSSTIAQTVHCGQSPAMEVYPNPVTDYVTVKVPNAGGVMSMYAVDGRLVETHKVVSQIDVVDVTRLAKGVYMLQYVKDNKTETIKLLKK